MEWYDALWVGDRARTKKRSIIKAVKEKKKFPDAFAVILSPNPALTLEIQPVDFMASSVIHTDDYFIIGIAVTKSEAFGLVEKITDYVWRATGGLDYRAFFTQKE